MGFCMQTKNIALICANNEEALIGQTIELLRRVEPTIHIIMVNDGSTDHTAVIAAEKKCEVINLETNTGKSNAFFTGLNKALAYNPTAILSIDADMVKIPKKGFLEGISAAEKATAKGKPTMLVAPFANTEKTTPTFLLSGARFFSRQAAESIIASKTRHLAKGYGLELWLESELGKFRVNMRSENFVQRMYPKDASTIKRRQQEMSLTQKLLNQTTSQKMKTNPIGFKSIVKKLFRGR